jgi:hypothetical protein
LVAVVVLLETTAAVAAAAVCFMDLLHLFLDQLLILLLLALAEIED